MKLLNKIGDNLFRITDRFFLGSRPSEHCSAPSNFDSSGQYMVWELNQGVEDILIKDIWGSISFFIPALIRKRIEQIYKDACLYFLVDAVIEDETIDPEADKVSGLNVLTPLAEKKIILIARAKKGLNRNILNLQDWVKIRLHRVRYFLRHLRPGKTFYLLGNFSPARNDLNFDGLNYILHDSDKTNFRHTFIFHKRN
jgi:hypothetical protein